MGNDEEQFVFDRMIKGDKEAFRFFFEKYYPDLCNLVNLYLHDSQLSEEIVQDIFIYFWEKRDQLKINTSVKSYLLRASKNKSLNYLRDEKRKMEIRSKLFTDNHDLTEMPDQIFDAQQLRTIINRAIDNLPERCREVYVMGREKSLTYKEISEELGISVKTVEAQMGRALRKLREQLKPYYNDIFIFFLICITY